MEYTGIGYDKECLTPSILLLEKRMNALQAFASELISEEVNLGSVKQTHAVIYDKLKLGTEIPTNSIFTLLHDLQYPSFGFILLYFSTH